MKKLLIVLLMFSVVSCAKESKMGINPIVETQVCTVDQLENGDTVVSCPDGVQITIPPQVINTVTNTITEVPVIVEIPTGKYCKNKKGDK